MSRIWKDEVTGRIYESNDSGGIEQYISESEIFALLDKEKFEAGGPEPAAGEPRAPKRDEQQQRDSRPAPCPSMCDTCGEHYTAPAQAAQPAPQQPRCPQLTYGCDTRCGKYDAGKCPEFPMSDKKSLCSCGHDKRRHFFGDNADLSTPCQDCECKNYHPIRGDE